MRKLVSAYTFTLFSCVILATMPGASAQGDGHTPGMTVESGMSLTSIGALEGTGSLEITFSGESAQELRLHILSEFDDDMNQVLDREEAKGLLVALADTISGRAYWGVTLNVTTDFAGMALTDLAGWAEGLYFQEWDSPDDISFKMDLECSGEGFSKVIFITDSAVNAFVGAFNDCTGYSFEGTMRLSHRLVGFGFGSFTSPEVVNGTLQELRTPAGVVIWYSADLEVRDLSAMMEERISYERFSVMENHQIAFVILLIGTLLMARIPRRRFENFRKLHPKRYRKYARQKNSVRISAIALIALMWLLYVLPFTLSFASGDFLIYSIYFLFLVPAAIISEHFYSKYVYNKSALDIPEESVIEVRQAMVEDEEEEVALCYLCYRPVDIAEEHHRCESCGTDMHIACAERAQACPACGAILFPRDTRSIECKICGESFLHSGKEDPYSIQCTRCGAFQEEVEPGKNYLVFDRDPTMAYRMIRAMGISNRPAMVMTADFPGKIRADFELGEEVDVRWLSDSTTDIDNVNPMDLDGDAMETASTFLMTTKRAGLMLDSLSGLVELNGFDKVVAFIRRLNDLAAIHGSSILLYVDKSAFDEDQLRVISDEFDEIHDYL